ncbi:MAG: 30S ribosomal protein S1 [Desulfosalsimonas sp.]
MTEQNENSGPEGSEEEESFEQLFESYMKEVKDDLREGEQVTGEIIAISSDTVFVNTGTKADGVVDKSELADTDGTFPYGLGDRVTLYVVSRDESEVRLSKAMAGQSGIHRIYEAHRSGIPVQGRVTETCKGGFRISIAGRTAFCPVSQMDAAYVEEPESWVGADYEFLISRIEEHGRNIVVSRRELLKRRMAEQKEEFLKTVSPGDIVEGRVTRIMPYGAFVELTSGVEGMVHISELSWSRIDNPEDAVSANDRLQVKILEITEPEDSGKQTRIALSAKQAQGDPWENISEKFASGQKVEGRVTRCADFGAFVEIAPGVEGLVHISEMSYKKRVIKASDVVLPGDSAAVMIKSIDPEKRRISLSMKDAEGDPWINIKDRYQPGTRVEGTVEKKESFGWFVALEPGVVGLLPISKINASPMAGRLDRLKTEDPVSVVVETVNPAERKISLGVAEDPDSGEWKSYGKAGEQTRDSGLGELGEKLRQALDSKK